MQAQLTESHSECRDDSPRRGTPPAHGRQVYRQRIRTSLPNQDSQTTSLRLRSVQYDILSQFADYLVNKTLNPASQPTITETFMVEAVEGSANLAVQGILALRAMADISSAHGDSGSQNKYRVR